jgi:hypothetical protein
MFPQNIVPRIFISILVVNAIFGMEDVPFRICVWIIHRNVYWHVHFWEVSK